MNFPCSLSYCSCTGGLFYLRNDGDEPAIGKMWVDDVFIGYNVIMEAKRVRNGIGLWNVRGNIQSDTALQFSLQTNRGGASSKSRSSASPHFGRVVVDFYEDLGSGVEKRHPDLDRDGGADFQKEQAKVNQTDQIGGTCAGKKAFKTDVGGHQTAGEVCEPMVGESKLGKLDHSILLYFGIDSQGHPTKYSSADCWGRRECADEKFWRDRNQCR